MTNKDWILLLVPVLFNGVIYVLFQKFILDNYLKRRMLHEETVKTFMNMVKDMYAHLIQSNFDSQKDGDSINVNLPVMEEKLEKLVKYYHTNEYDLKKFKSEMQSVIDSWSSFQNKKNECAKAANLTNEMRVELGQQMQRVFDALGELNKIVRKKY